MKETKMTYEAPEMELLSLTADTITTSGKPVESEWDEVSDLKI